MRLPYPRLPVVRENQCLQACGSCSAFLLLTQHLHGPALSQAALLPHRSEPCAATWVSVHEADLRLVCW